MVRTWGRPTCFKLVTNLSAVEIKLTKMQRNLHKKTLVNATLHLIFGDRFQKVNTQNLKHQCITHFCVICIVLCNVFTPTHKTLAF